jgi:hypothetical protein
MAAARQGIYRQEGRNSLLSRSDVSVVGHGVPICTKGRIMKGS